MNRFFVFSRSINLCFIRDIKFLKKFFYIFNLKTHKIITAGNNISRRKILCKIFIDVNKILEILETLN